MIGVYRWVTIHACMGEASGDRVRFGRIDRDWVRESGLLCADMHFHTHFSDSYTKVPSAIALAKKRGCGLAITDHNLIGGALEAFESWKPGDPFLIPGIEISSWDGPHILVYFYSLDELKEYWEGNVRPYISKSPWLNMAKGTEWILDSLEDVNCVVSGAHPLGYLGTVKGVQKAANNGTLPKDIGRRFDAYEVICSGMFRGENVKAWKKADEFGIGYTGGSDGHLLSEVGSVITLSDANDLDEFLDNIVKHRNMVMGKEKMIYKKAIMGMASVSRFITAYPLSSIEEKVGRIVHTHSKNRC